MVEIWIVLKTYILFFKYRNNNNNKNLGFPIKIYISSTGAYIDSTISILWWIPILPCIMLAKKWNMDAIKLLQMSEIQTYNDESEKIRHF